MKAIKLEQVLETLGFNTKIRLLIIDYEYNDACDKELGIHCDEYPIETNTYSIKKNLSHLLSRNVIKINPIIVGDRGSHDPVLVIKITDSNEEDKKG